MNKPPRQRSPAERAAIVRRHLVDKVPVWPKYQRPFFPQQNLYFLSLPQGQGA
jgi:hypothetical protein